MEHGSGRPSDWRVWRSFSCFKITSYFSWATFPINPVRISSHNRKAKTKSLAVSYQAPQRAFWRVMTHTQASNDTGEKCQLRLRSTDPGRNSQTRNNISELCLKEGGGGGITPPASYWSIRHTGKLVVSFSISTHSKSTFYVLSSRKSEKIFLFQVCFYFFPSPKRIFNHFSTFAKKFVQALPFDYNRFLVFFILFAIKIWTLHRGFCLIRPIFSLPYLNFPPLDSFLSIFDVYFLLKSGVPTCENTVGFIEKSLLSNVIR